MKNKKNFVSVVVCAYNEEKNIKDCLESLVKQNYPREKHEIIVVDDGSTDRTARIVSKYPVRLISHNKNLGIPSARNAGLKNAKGKIIVYIDGDCVAKTDWLKNLVGSYNDKNVFAVGGLVLVPSDNTLTEKYMSKSAYGNPKPIEFGESKSPFHRLLIYLKDMFKPLTKGNRGLLQVLTISGANSSFKKEKLLQVKGFNEKLKTSEDTDICLRLNKEFKGQKIILNKDAVVYHNGSNCFTKLIKKTFFSGEDVFNLYLEQKMIPPIFPFPIFILLLGFTSGYFNLLLGAISFLVFPQLFYLWWQVRFTEDHKFYYFLFPYMQFSFELTLTLGMVRGFIKLKFKNLNANEASKK